MLSVVNLNGASYCFIWNLSFLQGEMFIILVFLALITNLHWWLYIGVLDYALTQYQVFTNALMKIENHLGTRGQF